MKYHYHSKRSSAGAKESSSTVLTDSLSVPDAIGNGTTVITPPSLTFPLPFSNLLIADKVSRTATTDYCTDQNQRNTQSVKHLYVLESSKPFLSETAP